MSKAGELTAGNLQQKLVAINEASNTEDLRVMLLDCLNITVEQIVYMAAIVKRLEELGDNLYDLNIPLLHHVRRIAYGQVEAELVVHLLGHKTLLRKASCLPLPVQKRLADGESVKVMEPDGDHRMVPAVNLNSKEVKQVFAADHIRDDAEQSSWLRERAQPVETLDAKWEAEKIFVDKRRSGLVVGERFIPTADLARYLSQLTEKPKRAH